MGAAKKYLTFTPWCGQLNNTRMCFEMALVLAFISQRTLVTPACYRRSNEAEFAGNEFRPIDPREYLDLRDMERIVEMIPYERYTWECARPCSDSIDLSFETGSAVFCYPAIPDRDSPEWRRLQDFAAGRQQFFEFTPEMLACQTLNLKSAALEHFYSFLFFAEQEHDRVCKRLIRDYMRFRSEIISIAGKIAELLGCYGAIHVRRNDFFWQRPEQNVPASRILLSLFTRIPRGSYVYIATDETNKHFFSDMRNHYRICFLEDFANIVARDMTATCLACLEQMICAFARVFVGTRLSTFSAYITRLRGYCGAADQGIHFTDGPPGGEIDSYGAPQFSWINWLRSGYPLWGREYREAWEF